MVRCLLTAIFVLSNLTCAFASTQDIAEVQVGKAWPDINFIFGKTTRADVERYFTKKGAVLTEQNVPGAGSALVAQLPPNQISKYEFSGGALSAVYIYYPSSIYKAVLADVTKTLGPSSEAYHQVLKRRVQSWEFDHSFLFLDVTDNPSSIVLTHYSK